MTDNTTLLYFAGELTDLLTCPHDKGTVVYLVDRATSIKDVIEALGVPHTEVYDIRMNGTGHDFSLQLIPGTQITFLPANQSSNYPVDVTQATLLRPPLNALRFLVDENVAGLAPLLRALGFDTAYHRTWDDAYIAVLAAKEERVVLSRDRALLKRSAIVYGRLIRSQIVDDQLVEVLSHFSTPMILKPFSRCLRCNVVTTPVNKEDIVHLLEPKTRLHFNMFRRCSACKRIYWRGSHHEKLIERFERLGINIPLHSTEP
ncbi:Mut7-C RNAse domain-containing protein [Pseudodesulfovibrio sp. zrk46]|uniref:Mut7-C RNAse domain-containing protein n=1 Tax=Pseudodesulfovibrio sp. zrk46 TaxID=2725288 RepID=UPI001449E4B1|nr:Mut7-C RNAse domain-containing protein [Pseudodesulfovibrio sp. zrk46]QJB58234.1 hypothetical protein HFN16_18410 [Pseudodesulfovibrio sp. zrk46]